jgi:separase
MATKDDPTRLHINNVKADLQSTSTCSATTVATLQTLLLRKIEEQAQKENVRAKVQTIARKRAATATADTVKDTSTVLSPRDKYVLATEVANTTLKNLADALKSPLNPLTHRPSSQLKTIPSEDARKPARSRTGHAKSASVSKRPLKERCVSQLSNSPQKPKIRRSSSYSSFLAAGPDTGLVSTAECARIAFAYLGTLEATKVLGKDSQELQLESGILALVGKLVALGLDGLATKEIRHLKKRLDRFLGINSGVQRPGSRVAEEGPQGTASGEKESLVSLLHFAEIAPGSPAVPLAVSLQMYTLRLISRSNRPRLVEACWDHLKLSNPCSPANLINHIASTPNGQTKAARQLETLAQTILALCPHISSSHDGKPLQPLPETVLLLQQLAFSIRKKWWVLANHQGSQESELLEPFAKCLVAFARRCHLPPDKKYSMAECLYTELRGSQSNLDTTDETNSTANRTLSSLAQAAGLSEQALRWLGKMQSTSTTTTSHLKRSARLLRIATVTIEAFIKDDTTPGLEDVINHALENLKGSLSGSSSELDDLFLEVNAFRRAATRLLIANLPNCEKSVEEHAIHVIAASVHFSARIVGAKTRGDADLQGRQHYYERMIIVSKCTKSIIDSILACCKRIISSEEQWQELDLMLQECLHIMHRLEKGDQAQSANPGFLDQGLFDTLLVKLSNAYWAVSLQLRKTKLGSELITTAMQRSISLVQPRSQAVKREGHVAMKLEQLGDTLESLNNNQKSRKAFTQCIQTYIDSVASVTLSTSTATQSLHKVFRNEGPLGMFARVMKSHHRSFLKCGISDAEDLAFFDDLELHPSVRGALLEWQLTLYLRTLSKNRQWDTSLNPSLVTLVERLQEVYTLEKYPIRRLRLHVALLQLSQSHADIVPIQSIWQEVSDNGVISTAGSEDVGLTRYEPHLKALCTLQVILQQTEPSTSTLKKCFSAWEDLVNASASWEGLADRVDDVETWVSDISASVELLNAKGEEYLALPVLHLLVKIGELRRDPDASELVTSLCALALQFLRLGYTGKAGMSLAKAETLVAHQALSTEAKLRWHIAYTEYLARLGNLSKGSEFPIHIWY